ncbi:MAG: flavodoxin family protein [Desulfobacteraceae bacterium]|nr:flavodoxin family protein [Desulfobacteraceae bacterium]
MNPIDIAIILGSPRKNGNSIALAGQVERGARDSGATVGNFYLHGMDIGFCNGCGKCRERTSKTCVIDDDMQMLYPKLRQAQAILFASPVYWAHVSGQMKVFMDRCFALGGPEGHDMEGKRYGIILTYANSDHFKSGTINAIRTFQDSFRTGIVDIICGNAMGAGEIKENRSIMDSAYNLGKQLVRS